MAQEPITGGDDAVSPRRLVVLMSLDCYLVGGMRQTRWASKEGNRHLHVIWRKAN